MTESEWPCAISIVIYSGTKDFEASSSMNLNSFSFTPTEIEANSPHLASFNKWNSSFFIKAMHNIK